MTRRPDASAPVIHFFRDSIKNLCGVQDDAVVRAHNATAARNRASHIVSGRAAIVSTKKAL
jgi:hypothetical protein